MGDLSVNGNSDATNHSIACRRLVYVRSDLNQAQW